MGLEVATFISDLVPANPGSGDLRSQGDDHIRLEKQVLQNTFPNAGKAFYFPSSLVKTADFTVLAANQNVVFYCDPTGATINMTLPTLTAGDAGWECYMIKSSNSTNPILIKPPSGSLVSGGATVTAARRSIPGVKITCAWSGSAWFVTRSVSDPVGALISMSVSTLPVGYEWPNGQTLSSAVTAYPEFYVTNGNSGLTIDKRGRTAITLDNLGGAAAGRLPGGIISGSTFGGTGGTDTVTLGITQVPAHTHVNTLNDPTHTHALNPALDRYSPSIPGNLAGGVGAGSGPISVVASSTGITITNASQGGGLAHSNLQPSIMLSEVLVVE